jgi:hypothetical protein
MVPSNRRQTGKELQPAEIFGYNSIVRKWKAIDPASVATEEMKAYCAAHPGSPTAVRRPQLLIRSDLWIAQLGPNDADGIVGIGRTVEAALQAFDSEYLARLRPPARSAKAARGRSRRSVSPDKAAADFAF